MAKKRKYDNRNVQTTLSVSMVDEKPNDNKTFPYGLLRTVRHYLEFIAQTFGFSRVPL